jgi:PAS domain S-box-containing protein
MARTGMTIGSKFNLILILFFLVLLTTNAFDDYQRQQELAIKGAVDHARILARQIIETRNYLSNVVKGEPEQNEALIPQVAATQVAKTLSAGSKFLVRQVSMRFRNPDNRPDAYEQRLLARLAAGDTQERYEVVAGNEERVFRYLLPMIAEKSCLECHGSYDAAPSFVRKRFPAGHPSYNYREGEVIGAVSIAIPMSELYQTIGINLKKDMLLAGGSFFVMLLVMGWLTRRVVIGPIRQLCATITQVTVSGTFHERLPERKGDEVGQVFAAFNALMAELEGKTAQSQESAERYRNLIEMSQSAIITFMTDGKIISVNQRAETLFGLPRLELLGESIFTFFIDGEHLQNGLAAYERTGTGGGVGEISRHQVRCHEGACAYLEISLAASVTEGRTLFTMILRDTVNR